MKMLFRHKDHTVVVTRNLASAELVIDDQTHDIINGFGSTQLHSFDLNGKAKNADGTVDDVHILVKFGFPCDEVSFYYNNKLIDTQKSAL